jgi:hypothetical protein
MPIDDWQFWIATLAFVAAGVYVLRHVLPWPGSARRRARRGRRATLTVGGRPVGGPDRGD